MRIRSLWLAIIALGSVLACLPGASRTQANEGDRADQANNPQTTGGNVPAPEGSGESGSLNPDCPSLPSDLPIAQDAAEMSEYQGWCSYATGQDYQAVVNFNSDYLSSSGWDEFRTVESGSQTAHTHFYYRRDGEKIAIGILDLSSVQKVAVTIYPGHWIDQHCDRGGSGLPTPADIPIIGNMIGQCAEEYPWDDQGWTAYRYEFTTLEDFDTTLEYYRSELPERGWSYEQEFTSGDIIQMYFVKPGRTGTVQAGLNNYVQGTLDHLVVALIPTEEYGDTLVKIVVTAE